MIGIGIIGCGYAAVDLHLRVLRDVREGRVVAAADVNPERLRAVSERYEIPLKTLDWRDVLAHPDVEVVGVLVPPARHAEITIAALDAGKHVLVEKPLATTLDDCDRMIESAARSDRVVMVGFNMRWHRLVRRTRAIVESGRLGPLSLVRSTFTGPARFQARYQPWRKSRETGGGALIEIGVHHYDLWRHLLASEVEEIQAMVVPGDGAASVSARMTSGTVVSAGFSEMTGGRNEIDLFGESGQLHLSTFRVEGLETADVHELYPGSVRSRLKRMRGIVSDLPEITRAMLRGGDFIESYAAEWRGLLASVRSGRAEGPTLLDGRRALEVALAAAESASTGRPVECSRVQRSFAPGSPAMDAP